jgi:hypothetical protein
MLGSSMAFPYAGHKWKTCSGIKFSRVERGGSAFGGVESVSGGCGSVGRAKAWTVVWAWVWVWVWWMGWWERNVCVCVVWCLCVSVTGFIRLDRHT